MLKNGSRGEVFKLEIFRPLSAEREKGQGSGSLWYFLYSYTMEAIKGLTD